MIRAESVPVFERPDVRQFVKFCIVGASSFTIDVHAGAAARQGGTGRGRSWRAQAFARGQ